MICNRYQWSWTWRYIHLAEESREERKAGRSERAWCATASLQARNSNRTSRVKSDSTYQAAGSFECKKCTYTYVTFCLPTELSTWTLEDEATPTSDPQQFWPHVPCTSSC
ncbi:hypothetical protein CBL_12224 [Carabus blaptoides fortunei]